MKTLSILLFLVLHATALIAQGRFQMMDLGDFPLENGQVIKNCKIAFRTFGQINRDSSNVMVLLPWYSGRSEHFAFAAGPEGMADSNRYFVLIIDPFGDGVSSSPSNSIDQPGAAFPNFTIRDMVNAQLMLLERKLGIRHVHATAGFSMGGMECFQWAVSYPDYMSKLIPIAGAAKPTPYDRLFYTTLLTSIEAGMNDSLGAVKARQLIGLLFAMHVYAESYIQQLSADSLYLEYAKGWAGGFANADLHNFARQTYALLHNNTFHGLSHPEKTVIENVRAKMFIIVNRNDRDVHPQSAIAFAQNKRAQLLELDSDFGHLSFFREFASIAPRVRAFLEQP